MAKEVNLFLDGIFDDYCDSPSKVTLAFNEWNDNSKTGQPRTLCGLLASEPTITTQNKWGPIISDISNLTDLSSLLGAQSMFTWIGASVLCWKGTSPLSVGVDFYLINYRKGLQLEESLAALTKLTALAPSGNVTVKVHGGYAANQMFQTNESMFSNSYYTEKTKSTMIENMRNQGLGIISGNAPTGTVSLKIGKRVTITNLLVSRIDSTPSNTEVAEGKALFYRVNVSLTGARPLLTTDVDNMYNVR